MAGNRMIRIGLALLAVAATMEGASAQPRPRMRPEPFTPRVIALAPPSRAHRRSS